ncbi:MAG: hypothetical protein L3J04_11350, partial [Robiginitomaculum sp.]|nr:hypothetical protein [Robiginitomaculum sp.]
MMSLMMAFLSAGLWPFRLEIVMARLMGREASKSLALAVFFSISRPKIMAHYKRCKYLESLFGIADQMECL